MELAKTLTSSDHISKDIVNHKLSNEVHQYFSSTWLKFLLVKPHGK